MNSCDPCVAEPLNQEELKQAGVFWSSNNVFISRLHIRYTRDKFPEDLQFQETANQQFFQGRYIMRHPYKGEMSCKESETYQKNVRDRQEKEAQTLAQLTRWNINEIRGKINFIKIESSPWWQHLWRSWRRVFNT